MGVEVIPVGRYKACLYDNTTGLLFGPIFEAEADAEAFLCDLREVGERDPRVIPALELARLKDEWEKELENA